MCFIWANLEEGVSSVPQIIQELRLALLVTEAGEDRN